MPNFVRVLLPMVTEANVDARVMVGTPNRIPHTVALILPLVAIINPVTGDLGAVDPQIISRFLFDPVNDIIGSRLFLVTLMSQPCAVVLKVTVRLVILTPVSKVILDPLLINATVHRPLLLPLVWIIIAAIPLRKATVTARHRSLVTVTILGTIPARPGISHAQPSPLVVKLLRTALPIHKLVKQVPVDRGPAKPTEHIPLLLPLVIEATAVATVLPD